MIIDEIPTIDPIIVLKLSLAFLLTISLFQKSIH